MNKKTEVFYFLYEILFFIINDQYSDHIIENDCAQKNYTMLIYSWNIFRRITLESKTNPKIDI